MMTIARLHDLFESHAGSSTTLSFDGKCHDCQKDMNVMVAMTQEGFAISGGALFEPEPDKFFTKCDECYRTSPRLSGYQKCEVYSRVVGYLRPVSQWNEGKQAEFADRKHYRV